MLKALVRSQAFARAAGALVGAYMRAAGATIRWDWRGREHIEPFWREGRPVILAIWHGRLTVFHKCWPGRAQRTAHVLVSQSREGELAAAAGRFLGYGVVRGSTDKAGKAKGGLPALREMLKRLAAGDAVAITPDGPRGPRMRLGLGAVQLARLSGAPIVPIAWSAKGARPLDSWDRFLVPPLFSRGLFIWGAPVSVPRDASEEAIEAIRAGIEAEMNRLIREVDAWAGAPEIDPAPQAAPALGQPSAS